MELSALLGDAYKDGMTLEEVTEALKGVEMPKDQTAEIANLKELISKRNSEINDWKDKYKSTLDEASRKKSDEDENVRKLQEEIESLKKERTISGYKASYIGMGYSEADAGKIAELLTDGKMDEVLVLQKKHQDAMAEQIKKDLLKNTPRPDGGKDDGGDENPNIAMAKQMAKSRAATVKSSSDILDRYLK